MRYRRIAILLTIIILYIMIAANNPPQWFKAFGYNQVLDAYGWVAANHAPLNWIRNPGLRPEVADQANSAYALIPHDNTNHQHRIESALKDNPSALIECSAIDSWHTTTAGQQALSKIRDHTYRVVVFDGGHHLPTLGLEPDILLIPVLKNAAVHSYMRDGMSVQVLQQLLEKTDSPSVAVTVSRWLVVKRPGNLETITERIVKESGYRSGSEDHGFRPCASSGMSWYNGYIMAYVSGSSLEDPGDYANRIRELNQDIKEVFIAFNYNEVDPNETMEWADQLGMHLGTAVTVVNRPVKVSDLLLGR